MNRIARVVVLSALASLFVPGPSALASEAKDCVPSSALPAGVDCPDVICFIYWGAPLTDKAVEYAVCVLEEAVGGLENVVRVS